MQAVANKIDFPALEKGILSFWADANIFKKSLAQRLGQPEFVFYDGPPFATGLPHYGHLLAGTIKDIIPRYRTMRGNYVERRFGWDCHGLPVEYEMEQELAISGKQDIEKLGVDVFNEKCRSIVFRYTKEWQQVVTRIGRWVDFANDYKTMDLPFMESVWSVFKSLWDKGLIYEGRRIVPYCPRCATPLSNFETNQGYRDVQDPAVTISFPVLGQENVYLLAWTTTPWTLPSNLALAVGPNITYVKVQDGDKYYIMAKERMPFYYAKADGREFHVVEEFSGQQLAGWRYEPLFPYFTHLAKEGAFVVATADFVSTSDGTGIVHVAPGFGEDDYNLGRQLGLPPVCPVDDEARFTAEVVDYVGQIVKETDSAIIQRLKKEGRLIHRATINHSYPHCWRCDTPLIYRGIATWFVKVEEFRDKILANNAQTRWLPENIRDGRFGKWVANARDWNISRNRYWGTPLPIWKSEDGEELVCVGSVAELEKLTGEKVQDLHKHFVDRLVIKGKNGKLLRRIPEVLDCWFESGAMPYAQAHYPFENTERFQKNYPADFIAEGLDQTRGWFYTLMVLGTALFDKPAFKNVIVNGLILAEDGRKMSKRLKNYPDPTYILETYGADALRLYMINSPVVKAEDLCFSEEGVKHTLRSLLLPWWNAYSFFVTYAMIDGWDPSQYRPLAAQAGKETDEHLLDRWILSALEKFNNEVATGLESYDLQKAIKPFAGFIDALTNWYIRRSRRRFWKSANDEDKGRAYSTLYEVLLRLCKIMAPFVPFVTEAMYSNLRTADMPESVHLCDYPEANKNARDLALEEQMAAVMAVVSMGRQIRSERDLKIRQPLSLLHVVCRDDQLLQKIALLKTVIAEELNIKNVAFGRSEAEMATFSAKPNYRLLGPKLGPDVKKLATIVQGLSSEQLEHYLNTGSITVTIGDKSYELTGAELVVDRQPKTGLAVASDGGLVVALETNLTEELIKEGLARELVNRIQNMRKGADLQITDRIKLTVSGDDQVFNVVNHYLEYIKSETLADELQWVGTGLKEEDGIDLNGHKTYVKIGKAKD